MDAVDLNTKLEYKDSLSIFVIYLVIPEYNAYTNNTKFIEMFKTFHGKKSNWINKWTWAQIVIKRTNLFEHRSKQQRWIKSKEKSFDKWQQQNVKNDPL